jgi:hypothetical protein
MWQETPHLLGTRYRKNNRSEISQAEGKCKKEGFSLEQAKKTLRESF